MFQLIFPSDPAESLASSHFYLFLTAMLLFFGKSLLAATTSAIVVFVLFEKAHVSTRLEKWLLVSVIFTMLSIGIWILLFLSTKTSYYKTKQDATNAWIFGITIQKLSAIVLAYLVYDEASVSGRSYQRQQQAAAMDYNNSFSSGMSYGGTSRSYNGGESIGGRSGRSGVNDDNNSNGLADIIGTTIQKRQRNKNSHQNQNPQLQLHQNSTSSKSSSIKRTRLQEHLQQSEERFRQQQLLSSSSRSIRPQRGPDALIRRDSLVKTVKLHVRLIQGRGLVAKDTNIFGKKTTSDPYVKVYLGSIRTQLGQTKKVYKTLEPQWNQSFERIILARSISDYKNILCHLFDHDTMSKDDPMGTVIIPIPTMDDVRLVHWYPVQPGDGDTYCENATGEILVELEIKTKY